MTSVAGRITMILSAVVLAGTAALATLVATTSANSPGTGLKPRLMIDREIGFEIPKVTWRIYKTRTDLPTGNNRCTEAAKQKIPFEFVHEQVVERAGALILLRKELGAICVAAEFEAPKDADVVQKKYWSGLFDFTVLGDQIVERAFIAQFYEVPVNWGHKHGETIGSKAPYLITSVAQDIDKEPLFDVSAAGDGTKLLLPELHCFSAQAEYRFKLPTNEHLGTQKAQAPLPG